MPAPHNACGPAANATLATFRGPTEAKSRATHDIVIAVVSHKFKVGDISGPTAGHTQAKRGNVPQCIGMISVRKSGLPRKFIANIRDRR